MVLKYIVVGVHIEYTTEALRGIPKGTVRLYRANVPAFIVIKIELYRAMLFQISQRGIMDAFT